MNASKTKQERTRPSMRRLTALAGLGVCMCFSAVRAGTFNFPTAGGDLTTGWGDSVPTADDDVVILLAGRYYTTQTPVAYKSLRTGAKGGAVFDFSENGATATLSGNLTLCSTDKTLARASKLELLGGNWMVGGNLAYAVSPCNAVTTLVNAATLTIKGTLDIGKNGNDQVMSVVNGGKVTVGGRVFMSIGDYGQSLLEVKGKGSSFFASSATDSTYLSTGLGSNRVEISEGGYFEVTENSFCLGRTAGRGHDRLVVDGGSKAYLKKMLFGSANDNLVRIDNKSCLETACKPLSSSPAYHIFSDGCGTGNGIIIDHCSCWSNNTTSISLAFLSHGSNNFVRIDNGSSFCLPSGTFYFGAAAAEGPLNNRLFVGEDSDLSVPNLYFGGHGNALVVSNGTVQSAGEVNLAYVNQKNKIAGGTNTVVLSGCRPLVQTERDVKVSAYARIVVSPTEAGFEKDHVAVCCRDFTLDATSRLAVDADRFLQRTGGCLTVVRATRNMTVDSSALEASNADLPSGVRFEVNGRDLILRCPSRKGLMILLK